MHSDVDQPTSTCEISDPGGLARRTLHDEQSPGSQPQQALVDDLTQVIKTIRPSKQGSQRLPVANDIGKLLPISYVGGVGNEEVDGALEARVEGSEPISFVEQDPGAGPAESGQVGPGQGEGAGRTIGGMNGRGRNLLGEGQGDGP